MLKIAAATVLVLVASLLPGSYPSPGEGLTQFLPVPTSVGFFEASEKTDRMVAVEVLLQSGCSQKVSLQEGAMGVLSLEGKQELQFIVAPDQQGDVTISPQSKHYETINGHTSLTETIETSTESGRSPEALRQAGVVRMRVANVRDMNEDERRELAATKAQGAKDKLEIRCKNKDGSGCYLAAPNVCQQVCGGQRSRYFSSGVNCSGASCGACHS
ncbi:hypothetical protein [Chitinimonas sp.]|uniref:hypothetical protein n=1 Tax=Chitinimonas sp. TaxID=1934313 RepID=UPI002F93CBF4